MALILTRNRVIICLLMLLTLGPSAIPHQALAQSAVTPVITSAVAASLPSASITVTGNGFTSGGLVFVALYDQWGNSLEETRWTSASPAVYGPNGSIDPAQGYVAGGELNEVFNRVLGATYGPNGSIDPAQGYSPGVSAQEFQPAIYGPNGSMDPAQGYVPASGVTQMAGISCGGFVMARAFDRQTATWSNPVDVDFGC
jgi:hypothetical protein